MDTVSGDFSRKKARICVTSWHLRRISNVLNHFYGLRLYCVWHIPPEMASIQMCFYWVIFL